MYSDDVNYFFTPLILVCLNKQGSIVIWYWTFTSMDTYLFCTAFLISFIDIGAI